MPRDRLKKQKKWKMRRMFHVMTKQEGLGQLGDAVEAWSTHATEYTKAEYDRLYTKFAKAMRVAKKYEWSQESVV